jgi:hypothetical protein
MLSKLINLLPTCILDALFDAVFAELVKRGDIVLSDNVNNHDYN